MEKEQRTRLTTVLVLTLVFATGVVVGIAAGRLPVDAPAGDEALAAASGEGADRGEDADRRARREPVYERVGELTPDQRVRIDSVVDEYRAARDALREGWREAYDPLKREREAWEEENVEPLRREWGQRFDSLVGATRVAIKDVMTDEQALRYDSLLAEHEKRREERRRERDSSDGGRN